MLITSGSVTVKVEKITNSHVYFYGTRSLRVVRPMKVTTVAIFEKFLKKQIMNRGERDGVKNIN